MGSAPVSCDVCSQVRRLPEFLRAYIFNASGAERLVHLRSGEQPHRSGVIAKAQIARRLEIGNHSLTTRKFCFAMERLVTSSSFESRKHRFEISSTVGLVGLNKFRTVVLGQDGASLWE